jgi:hypothetical protein
MLTKKKVVLISSFLALAIIVPVFVYAYFYRTDLEVIAAGVKLQTPTMQLGFYLDEACTQPVTTFDFGEMRTPNQAITLYKIIYIRNEGDVMNTLFWNSTILHYPVTTEIADDWTHIPAWGGASSINSTVLDSGTVRQTYYMIHIPAYTTVGIYNWTLTAWGEY